MGGILKSTTMPSSRQCGDEVSRKRAWGKSRLEMLLILPLLPTILLILPHTAASPERASHALAHLLSSQSPFLLFPWTKAPRKHFSQNRQRSGAHQSRIKREIGQLNSKPPQQWSKQGERPPYFLPIPKLASNSIDFLVRPLDGINSFQISPPPPPPAPLPLSSSLRRALRWPPWPPDPHSAVLRWSHSSLPRLGGEVPKSGQEGLQGREGLQRLRGKGSPQWHIWNLGPPRRIRGIPVEPSLTKGGQASPKEQPQSFFERQPSSAGESAHTRWQNAVPFVCVVAWSPDCSTLLSAMHFADPKGRLDRHQNK